MTKLLMMIVFAAMTATAHAEDLVYIGSCSWGNTSSHSGTHAGGNALASLYILPSTGEAFVWNRITPTDENYCVEPVPRPLETDLVSAAADESGFWWKDAPEARTSGLTLVGSITGQVQAATAPFNHKQKLAGGVMLAYPTCFLMKSL